MSRNSAGTGQCLIHAAAAAPYSITHFIPSQRIALSRVGCENVPKKERLAKGRLPSFGVWVGGRASSASPTKQHKITTKSRSLVRLVTRHPKRRDSSSCKVCAPLLGSSMAALGTTVLRQFGGKGGGLLSVDTVGHNWNEFGV
ncbi:hypothetical protein Ddc_01759 [Ditylenchus destructor]|nr:hypothetical protein Ddc_01759 [Ditylenchus destructor]